MEREKESPLTWPTQVEMEGYEEGMDIPDFADHQDKVKQSDIKIGDKLGLLTILSFEKKNLKSRSGNRRPVTYVYAKVRCDCGVEKSTKLGSIAAGLSRSCGRCGLRYRNSDQVVNAIRHFKTYTLSSAKKRGLKVDLSLEQIRALIFRHCDYCGAAPVQKRKGNSTTAPFNGLDRVDSSKGYEVGNVVTCCWTCNTAKLDMSLEEFKAHVARIHARLNVEKADAKAVQVTPRSWKFYDGLVVLNDSMGSDLSVVNAARVSFGTQKSELDDKDLKLIKFLAEHKHMSPFRHVQISLILEDIPEFVLRQLYKHQVGMAYSSGEFRESATVWNELSGRYVEFDFKFFEPVSFRPQHASNKQASYHDRTVPHENKIREIYRKSIGDSFSTYQKMLEMGVSKEQARMVIPLSFNSSVIWTGSLEAFVHFVKLRDHEGAQLEIVTLAKIVGEIVRLIAPVSCEALLGT